MSLSPPGWSHFSVSNAAPHIALLSPGWHWLHQWYCGTVVLWYCGTVVLWYWYCGTDTVVLWYCGTGLQRRGLDGIYERRCDWDRGEVEYKIQLQCLVCTALQCNTGVPPQQATRSTQCDINTTSQCGTSPPPPLQQDELAQHWVFYPPSQHHSL